MVSTRRSPQKKTRPTGVPTLSGQARVRAERAEQRNEQRSADVLCLSVRFMYVLCLSARFMLIRPTTKIVHLMLITK